MAEVTVSPDVDFSWGHEAPTLLDVVPGSLTGFDDVASTALALEPAFGPGYLEPLPVHDEDLITVPSTSLSESIQRVSFEEPEETTWMVIVSRFADTGDRTSIPDQCWPETYTGTIGLFQMLAVGSARNPDPWEAPPDPPGEPMPPAYRAFKEIGVRLGAGDEQVARAVGIGRTTVYSWYRDGREPRRGTARRIYELQSVISSLYRKLGDEGLAAWLRTGSPSRRERLLEGDLEMLNQEIDSALFHDEPGSLDLAWRGEEPAAAETGSEAGSRPPRAIRRKARAVRRPR